MSASEYALTAEDNVVHAGMVMGWKKQGTVKEMGVAAEKSLKVPTSEYGPESSLLKEWKCMTISSNKEASTKLWRRLRKDYHSMNKDKKLESV